MLPPIDTPDPLILWLEVVNQNIIKIVVLSMLSVVGIRREVIMKHLSSSFCLIMSTLGLICAPFVVQRYLFATPINADPSQTLFNSKVAIFVLVGVAYFGAVIGISVMLDHFFNKK